MLSWEVVWMGLTAVRNSACWAAGTRQTQAGGHACVVGEGNISVQLKPRAWQAPMALGGVPWAETLRGPGLVGVVRCGGGCSTTPNRKRSPVRNQTQPKLRCSRACRVYGATPPYRIYGTVGTYQEVPSDVHAIALTPYGVWYAAVSRR